MPGSAPDAILETSLYATDLAAAKRFYTDVLGLHLYDEQPGRHLFFRCGAGMLLIFDPSETSTASLAGSAVFPPHGARGAGHVCFAAAGSEIDHWRDRLTGAGVTIEADMDWPGGGRSIYFRDPAGNSLEFADPRIWE